MNWLNEKWIDPNINLITQFKTETSSTHHTQYKQCSICSSSLYTPGPCMDSIDCHWSYYSRKVVWPCFKQGTDTFQWILCQKYTKQHCKSHIMWTAHPCTCLNVLLGQLGDSDWGCHDTLVFTIITILYIIKDKNKV